MKDEAVNGRLRLSHWFGNKHWPLFQKWLEETKTPAYIISMPSIGKRGEARMYEADRAAWVKYRDAEEARIASAVNSTCDFQNHTEGEYQDILRVALGWKTNDGQDSTYFAVAEEITNNIDGFGFSPIRNALAKTPESGKLRLDRAWVENVAHNQVQIGRKLDKLLEYYEGDMRS